MNLEFWQEFRKQLDYYVNPSGELTGGKFIFIYEKNIIIDPLFYTHSWYYRYRPVYINVVYYYNNNIHLIKKYTDQTDFGTVVPLYPINVIPINFTKTTASRCGIHQDERWNNPEPWEIIQEVQGVWERPRMLMFSLKCLQSDLKINYL